MREQKTVQTPGGHEVVLNAYLTGRETREISSVINSHMKMGFEGELVPGERPMTVVRDFTGEFIAEQERKVLDFLIVSVNGSTENPVEKLLDLPAADFQFVKGEAEKISNPSTPGRFGQPGPASTEPAL